MTVACEEVLRAFSYHPETGEFRWKHRPAADFGNTAAYSRFDRHIAGTSAFTHLGLNGYRQGRLNYRLLLAHRVAFVLMTGAWPRYQVDHLNGDRSDNRWSNLRDVDQHTQNRNMSLRPNRADGRIGVTFDHVRNKWIAQGRSSYRQYNLGRFDSFEDAVAARVEFERQHGFHPNHGKPPILAR